MNEMMEASVYARGVAEETNIWGMQNQFELSRMILNGSKESGRSMQEQAQFMIDQFRNYRAVSNDLTWAYKSAPKFFTSTIWQDEKLWPWKNPQVGVNFAEPQRPDTAMAVEYWSLQVGKPSYKGCPPEIRELIEGRL